MRKHEIIADSQKQTDCGRGWGKQAESGEAAALSFAVLSVSASSGVALSLSFSFFLSLRPGHPLCLSPLEANSLSPHVPRTDIRESVDVCRPTSELIEFDSAVTCLTANRIANIFEPLVS